MDFSVELMNYINSLFKSCMCSEAPKNYILSVLKHICSCFLFCFSSKPAELSVSSQCVEWKKSCVFQLKEAKINKEKNTKHWIKLKKTTLSDSSEGAEGGWMIQSVYRRVHSQLRQSFSLHPVNERDVPHQEELIEFPCITQRQTRIRVRRRKSWTGASVRMCE